MKEPTHYINDHKINKAICGIETPVIPAGIWITHHFRKTTCPNCITEAFKNRSIISYVNGQQIAGEKQFKLGKIHCIVTYRLRGKDFEYETLCGIYDTCGNWEFSNEYWFNRESGCKKCQHIYNKLKKISKME